MNDRGRVARILWEAMKELGVEDPVRLVLYPMKYKVASASLKTRTIRLNKNLIRSLTDEEIRYIIIHELIHLILATPNHGEDFHKLLYTIYKPGEAEVLENNIVKRLIREGLRPRGMLL